MSLGIAINNEFLDLNPGTEMELEQNNPFLQFANELVGDLSLPFEVKPTPGNLRKLGYAGIFQKRMTNEGLDAALFDNGLQHSIGKVKVEKNNAHLNNLQQGSMSAYYLSAVSNFYQDIKDVHMRDIEYGGTRSFPWTDFQRRTGNGFWQHIHAVVDDEGGPYDYAFYPVINTSWDHLGIVRVMNSMESTSSTEPSFEDVVTNPGVGSWVNPIVPFPYLTYVLQKVGEHIGWEIQGDILTDPSFEKITLVNFQAIDWALMGGGVSGAIPLATITFDLQDHLPAQSVAEFFISLKNRLGIWYDFDKRNKIIHIKRLADVTWTDTKDFTTKSSPVIPKTINRDAKIYALKNQWVGDMGDGEPNFSSVKLQGEVNSVADLPTAAEAIGYHAYLVIEENNYYVCRVSDTDPYPWEWQLYASNIYDYLPDGNNEEIITECTTLGNEYFDAYLDFIPRIDLGGNSPGLTEVDQDWKLHLAFYYGKVNNKAGNAVCFASSGIYDSNGNELGDWSLAFKHKKIDGTEVGLYDLQWKPILDRLANAEEVEVTLWLDRVEYMNLRFSDEIMIAGVKLIIKTIKSVIPYKNRVVLDCVRV